ncbi:50S ribosomal protein L16 [Thermosipho africanus H17ap60334]|jgi:large subunit ribosomal protein L16|uniref:Large ribosomal subunit protein uL16 n=1 Tax=Thermosipho africanus (strain TCF52B) TaxID=484019 RepID=RL16_THEAB|nr:MULTISPECIES: 50S ribosomal protein L16 [Thermosipho]B7IHV3.1 RecName: Full=Large ribosomal subunit protein uL16; AltName: Full=50S ribosomal protein L16 [Thermosipho africanus TCF52B]ACJ75667.1 ribosomal protein L16 [Thermosipho africanus TCF52B]EKF49690.1 50S ribosomal protein L16 [Thermosipho africanus H17ap60334]MBZ4650529.1 rplP [Thermosipho sp. (in: thermotogales)]MDK2839134.1 large subunit ribosomal protein [Thermosipho sp. (in: thermotogales)]RDI91359.1 50S ribosomal protein L16 [T
MLMPKRVKYRKQHRGRMKGNAKGGALVNFGEYGLKAMESHWITAQQIEACRIAITRTLKKTGKLWIRVFPDKSYTKHPAESKLGKGKGNVEGWVAVVKPGKILFEIGGVDEKLAREALEYAATKLPIRTKIVKRHEIGGEAV